jgi:exosortase E/protease (VPEID-CTERM system)
VNSPASSFILTPRFGLLTRLLTVAALLAIETLLISGLIQSPALDELTGAAKLTHDIQHWAFRFVIAYAGSFAMLLYLRGADSSRAAPMAAYPVRVPWVLLHVALLAPFAALSLLLYRGGAMPFWVLSLGWHACGLAAAAALMAALAPFKEWAGSVRQTGALPLYAFLPAAGAMLAYRISQSLWAPAAALTFRLVREMLAPLIPSLQADAATMTLMTDRFAVQVSEICSGLEGVGLMLAFCAAWLWYFRREYIFPRALIIVPIALMGIFLLNSVRIAALVLIGDAGYPKTASIGFHSQAGWIAFNLAALGVAYGAKHSRWINRQTVEPGAAVPDATAAFLMPLLAILAAGMLTRAMSAGFDHLYSLRMVCALVALWVYRRSYGNVDRGFSWRGVITGVAVYGVWAACAHFISQTAAMPEGLAQLSAPGRVAWITCRAAGAIIIVPIAEELAYRGFLMRRIEAANFDSIPLSRVGWAAIAISAVAFGVMHGSLWFAGIIAGLAYGTLAVKTGKMGECIAAHATTNALVAAQVLLFGQWQLW